MKIATVRTHALSLPEVTEQPHFNFNSFRVRGKIFVTVPPEATHIHIFVAEQDRETALVLHSSFLEKLFWGSKVLGLRANLAAAEPAVIKALVTRAWRNKAPKGLAAKHSDLA